MFKATRFIMLKYFMDTEIQELLLSQYLYYSVLLIGKNDSVEFRKIHTNL